MSAVQVDGTWIDGSRKSASMIGPAGVSHGGSSLVELAGRQRAEERAESEGRRGKCTLSTGPKKLGGTLTRLGR